MNERYVYIDESGDLGEKGSKTFINSRKNFRELKN